MKQDLGDSNTLPQSEPIGMVSNGPDQARPEVGKRTFSENSNDKFGFGFFIAAIWHALIIFGIAFDYPDNKVEASSLDVTLVNHLSEQSPEEADYIAQANQQASGTLDEAATPTSPYEASRRTQQGTEGELLENRSSENTESGVNLRVLVAQSPSEDAEKLDREGHQQTEQQNARRQIEAKLARLDKLRQDYAKRPKLGFLTSVSAKAREDAQYQIHLQERIVEQGNLHYPMESIQQGIFGSLRLKLIILPSGHIELAEIAESSGHQILDSAAVRIARLSAPFAPFPSGLANKYDKIIFIRTWRFLPGGRIETQE